MRNCGLQPNIEIFNGLLVGATLRNSLETVKMVDLHLLNHKNLCRTPSILNINNFQLLQEFPRYQLKADDRSILTLESFHKSYQMEVKKIEKGSPDVNKFVLKAFESGEGPQNWKLFLDVYENWLRQTKVELPSHPWKQYLTEKDCALKSKGSLTFQEV